MEENNAIRAITIGVSTFIAMITISAVLMYYNTARATVQEIGTGTDISQNYSKYILEILLKPDNTTVSGTDVKNILNYFYLNERVNVNITKMTNLGSVSNLTLEESKNLLNVNNNKSLYNKVFADIISTEKFKIQVEYYDTNNTEAKTITLSEI